MRSKFGTHLAFYKSDNQNIVGGGVEMLIGHTKRIFLSIAILLSMASVAQALNLDPEPEKEDKDIRCKKSSKVKPSEACEKGRPCACDKGAKCSDFTGQPAECQESACPQCEIDPADAPDSLPSIGERLYPEMRLYGSFLESWGSSTDFGYSRHLNYLAKLQMSPDERYIRLFDPAKQCLAVFGINEAGDKYIAVPNNQNMPEDSYIEFPEELDGNARLVYPDGKIWEFEFEKKYDAPTVPPYTIYRINKRIDKHGNESTFFYTESTVPGEFSNVLITDASGNTYDCRVGQTGCIETITVNENTTWTYTYNEPNRSVVTETNPRTGAKIVMQVLQYISTANGGMTSMFKMVSYGEIGGAAGGSISEIYMYDITGTLAYQVINGVTTTYNTEFDPLGVTLLSATLNGNTITRAFGTNGLESKSNEEGETITYERNSRHRAEKITNALGHEWKYDYDQNDFILREDDPDGGWTTYLYDDVYNLLEKTTSDGTWINEYDEHNYLVKEIFPDGGETRYIRYPREENEELHPWRGLVKYELKKVETGKWIVSYHEYNDRGQETLHQEPWFVTDPANPSATQPAVGSADYAAVAFEYDDWGNMTLRTAANGIKTFYEYDGGNRVTMMTEYYETAKAASTIYEYDGIGRKIKQTDAIGAFTEWHYDSRGFISEISGSSANGGGCSSCGSAAGASGQLGTYEHNDAGGVESFTDLNGHTWLTSYDGAERKKTVTDPLDYITSYEYYADGEVSTITDANDNITTYTYTPNSNLDTITNAADEVTDFNHDIEGRVILVTDAAGGETSTTYDSMGRVATSTNSIGVVTDYTYNLLGQLTELEVGGVITTYAYDAEGNMESTTVAYGLPEEVTTIFTYDKGGNMLTSVVDPGGLDIKTEYVYEAETNRLLQVKAYPDGITGDPLVTALYDYDALGRVTSVTSGGVTRTTTYNNAGWVVQTSDGLTTTDIFYDEVGNRTGVKVSGRALVETIYDDANRLVGTLLTDGTTEITTSRILDGVGRVENSTDAEGKITSFTYDNANRVLTLKNPLEEITTYTYDDAGRASTVAVTGGPTLTYNYNDAGQLLSTSGGPGGTKSFSYDALGRLEIVTDANGRTRETIYDNLNRVVEVRNEMGQPVSYTYDKVGRRTALTDANLNTTGYAFDSMGRLTDMTYPAVANEPANNESYTYNDASQLIKKTTPNGDDITYGYAAGRLASVSFGSKTVAYTHDLAGAVTSIGGTGDVTTISHTYDQFGRVTAVTDSALAKTINYGYDRRGLRTSLNLDATSIGYGYDDAGRLTSVTKDADSPAVYGYDAAGRRESLTLPNGVVTGYVYDGNSRLDTLTTSNSTETLAAFDYTVDPTGNRDSITYADGSSSNYTYDLAYRLLSETRKKADDSIEYEVAFTYDAVGNRLTKTSTNAVEYAADADTQGLWHFEEPVVAGAVTCKDYSDNDNNLTGGSSLSVTDGRFGKALNFEGGYLTCADVATLELYDEDFTLEAWVKLDTLTGTQVIIQKWDDINDVCSYRLSLVEGIPHLELTTDGTSDNVFMVSGAEAITVDTWTHIAAVRMEDNVKLLVDKVEIATATTPFTGSVFDGAADVVVGYGFDGIIDELRYANADKSSILSHVSTTYAYNERNQLVTENTGATTKKYEYDKNGNNILILTMVGNAYFSIEIMTYDELNRMIQYQGPRGTESFTYRGDKWHRYTADGKTFLYDDDNVLADISGGTTSAFYVTPGLDDNMSMTTGGNTYYYSQDGLNSVRTLTDVSGVAVNSYDYLPFGGVYSTNTTTTINQRYTYTGREMNTVTPAMYYRNRFYSTNSGRFNRRDPIGYAGGVNVYSYVGNNPITYLDPFGLKNVSPAAAKCFNQAIKDKVLTPLRATKWGKSHSGVLDTVASYVKGNDFSFVFGIDPNLSGSTAKFKPTPRFDFFTKWYSAEIYMQVGCAYSDEANYKKGCADPKSCKGKWLENAKKRQKLGKTIVCECCWIDIDNFVGNVIHESTHAHIYSPFNTGMDETDANRGEELMAHTNEALARKALGYSDPYDTGRSLWDIIVEQY